MGEEKLRRQPEGDSQPAGFPSSEKASLPSEELSGSPRSTSSKKQVRSAQSGQSVGPDQSQRGPQWTAVRVPLVKPARLAESQQIHSMLPEGDGAALCEPAPSKREWRRGLVSFFVSALVHAVLLVVFSLWIIHTPHGLSGINLVATANLPVNTPLLESDLILETRPEERSLLTEQSFALTPATVNILGEEEGNEQSVTTGARNTGPLDPARPWGNEEPDYLSHLDRPSGGGLEGRTPEMRAKLAIQGDGSAESEEAVERGLRWIAVHQEDDGSWRFDLKVRACRGYCHNPGTEPSTTAATALALLPFLGAGYTHRSGPYVDTVHRGLYYLLRRGRQTDKGLDFQEGMKNGMYAQGLVAIVLCEAFAMTKDPALKQPAQEAVRFIEYAQDKAGGGWRYRPGEPGDTTVTGWQLMALKSAEMAGLKVDRSVHYAAQRFLDSVASEEGALYGYQDRSPRHSTTAIGLLCRMYAGWPRQHPPLARGIAHLAEWGPSETDLYYDYYATQVMRHWGGSDWKRWNETMREFLIKTQATEGHEAGSWYFDDPHSRVGGRLYTTAMAVMILEVYYRYMPLYGKEVFPGL